MRSQHAERMALLSVAASAASQNQRSRPDLQETRLSTWPCQFLHGHCQDCRHSSAALHMREERAADREFTFGSVRLYATHTLCISCLAVCCQFHRHLLRLDRWFLRVLEVLQQFTVMKLLYVAEPCATTFHDTMAVLSCQQICSLQGLFPRVSLKARRVRHPCLELEVVPRLLASRGLLSEVEMDTWDETLRWSCRKARAERSTQLD